MGRFGGGAAGQGGEGIEAEGAALLDLLAAEADEDE